LSATAPVADPCLLVIFGASGDLTKRLLFPALANLASDELLDERFAIIGVAKDELTPDEFRDRMGADLASFTTRQNLELRVRDGLVAHLDYLAGRFEDPEVYRELGARIERAAARRGAGGNVLFYLATPPVLFATIAEKIAEAGLHRSANGWRRLVVEKPFGHDLASAQELNRRLLAHWREEQIFRIDHYLGKETVQNLLAFRFSNGMFEPLWNRTHVDHIQFTVAETVGVEGRGRYYEGSGALRDMIQNHMFQMLAYLCMEPPSSLRADTIRNEKAETLDAVRIMSPEEVLRSTVRGQYGPGRKPDGSPARGYRQEPDVAPDSVTETFAALRLSIDTWRWEGVPIYLRSGKSLWKRGTEILVQFKRPPAVVFRDVPGVSTLASNQLIFHIQPDQGIEIRFQAKEPGPQMGLQKVAMRFDYKESFEAARGTGYEVLLYQAMLGEATLFTRNDLVEAAWRIVEPVLHTWAEHKPADFPNYEAGTWGPKSAFKLIEGDGRKWLEVINRAVLEKVPLFQGTHPVFLHGLTLVLRPVVYAAGDDIVRLGEMGSELYFVARGEVDVLDPDGSVRRTLGPGSFFGEKGLIMSSPRTATVRARTQCDLHVLDQADFLRLLREEPSVARTILEVCKTRYDLDAVAEQEFKQRLVRYVEI
jgi:glucose-6-phosphate 1-dehydrogenase